MKLYTEEQVKEAIMMARITQGVLATTFFCDEHEVFEKLTPMELPSDEEIKTESKFKSNYSNPQAVQFNPALNIVWIEGAKWMRNKIQGGNK
jgi:hypothetical protein